MDSFVADEFGVTCVLSCLYTRRVIIMPCVQLHLYLFHDVGKQCIFLFRGMQGFIGIVIEKRIIANFLFQGRAVQHVGMEQQCPSVKINSLSVVFFTSYLPRRDTYYCASALIVIFSTTILQINGQVFMHEHAIHTIVI